MVDDFILSNVYSSDSNEWYTPVPFVDAARKVLGRIDLDPASCVLANKVVRASRIYTQADDGLTQPWTGKIWMNPPYGRLGTDRQKGQTELWVNRLIQEYKSGNVDEAILLVNAYLYKQWFAPLWAYPICFPTGRLSFWNEKGESGRSPHSSALVYFGEHEQRFVDIFSRFGAVVKLVSPLISRDTIQHSLFEVL